MSTDGWRIIITGCGTSHGNPPWGIPRFWSDDPKDLRRRSGAVLLGPEREVLLIDCGPDLMHQLRDPDRTWDGRSYPQRSIDRCDGVLLTHDHADHSHGLNDLRHVNRLMQGVGDRHGIAIHGHRVHLDALHQMFPYCFSGGPGYYPMSNPALSTVPLEHGVPFTVAGLPILPFALDHGPAGLVTGFRCGDLAYLTDLKSMPPGTEEMLRGVDILVLSMLREQLHETHHNWQEAQDVIRRIAPRRTVLTHMGYEVRWAEWQAKLPPGVAMAWDGWESPFAVGSLAR